MTDTPFVQDESDLLARWGRAKKRGVDICSFSVANSMTVKAVELELKRLKLERQYENLYSQIDYSLGFEPWELSGDYMIVGDVHAPFTDYGFAGLVAKVAKKHMRKPRRLLVAGDLWEFSALSVYAQVVPPPSWKQDMVASRRLFEYWLKTFDSIEVLLGNHDRRLQKFLAGAIDDADLLALLKGNDKALTDLIYERGADCIRLSNFGWCTIDTPGGVWRVTHPKNYSKIQLRTVNELAQKFHHHVIGFHEHHASLGWSKCGHYCIVNGGCLVDDQKLAYVVMDDATNPRYQKAFVMLRDGTPYLFGESPMTDWSRWL